MDLGELEGAAKGNPPLRRVLQTIQAWATGFEVATGINPLAPAHAGKRKLAPPPLADMVVTGVDGHYAVDITNPTTTPGILHEIKAATTVPIGKSLDIITIGPTGDLQIDILDPGTTRYFQLRSKFPNSDYNQPQIFQAVSSGLLTGDNLSASNTTMTPTSNGPLLTQDSTTAVIVVHPFTMVMGSNNVGYGGGDVAVDDEGNPITFGTYYVYTLDAAKAGGAVTWQATQDLARARAHDDAVILTTPITLSVYGGGVTFPVGMGGGPAAGTLVTMSDGVTTRAVELLLAGDDILGLDGVETLQAAPTSVATVPSFTITTVSGKAITLSGDHNLQLGAGGRATVTDVVPGDNINTVDGQEQVTSKVLAGNVTVYRLSLSKNHFHTGNGIWCG